MARGIQCWVSDLGVWFYWGKEGKIIDIEGKESGFGDSGPIETDTQEKAKKRWMTETRKMDWMLKIEIYQKC